MDNSFYTTFPSPFETFTIVWKEVESNILIQRVFLSDDRERSEVKAMKVFGQIKKTFSPKTNSLGEKIQSFLRGEEVTFDLELLDFSKCYNIQQKVLLAEHKIPRGWVSTYQRIAYNVGITNGARVVGNSLARNPFPIFIPCHRAIKSNGELGGYQGGLKMKQQLLELEGIKFSKKGKVKTERIYY